MTTFLEGVNRVLRINTVIQGDDDDIDSFADTQHRATLNLAKIAIQSTLNELISDRLIPYEEADGNVTYVTGTRTYTLPGDFIRFSSAEPLLTEMDGSEATNNYVAPWPGGERSLENYDRRYRDQTGKPQWYYMVDGTTKKIGFYFVPDSSVNGVVLRYSYEKDVSVTDEGDDLPFHTTSEAYAFLDMSARYFQFLFTKQPMEGLENDIIYRRAKSALMELMKGKYNVRKYGTTYA